MKTCCRDGNTSKSFVEEAREMSRKVGDVKAMSTLIIDSSKDTKVVKFYSTRSSTFQAISVKFESF